MPFSPVFIDENVGSSELFPGQRSERTRFRKIEAILTRAAFDLVRPELYALSVEVVVAEVHACGPQDVRKQYYRGAEYHAFIPKLKVEIVVPAEQVGAVTAAFSEAARPELDKVLLYDMGPATPLPLHPQADLHNFFMPFL